MIYEETNEEGESFYWCDECDATGWSEDFEHDRACSAFTEETEQ